MPLIYFNIAWIYCQVSHGPVFLTVVSVLRFDGILSHCGVGRSHLVYQQLADRSGPQTYPCISSCSASRRCTYSLCTNPKAADAELWLRWLLSVLLGDWKSLNQALASAADTQRCCGSGPAVALLQSRWTRRPLHGQFRHWHHLILIDFNSSTIISKQSGRLNTADEKELCVNLSPLSL